MLFLWCLVMFKGTPRSLVDQITPSQSLSNHLVYLSPVRYSTDIAVVNPDISLNLSGEMIVPFFLLLRIIFVNGIKFHTSFTTPVDGIFQ